MTLTFPAGDTLRPLRLAMDDLARIAEPPPRMDTRGLTAHELLSIDAPAPGARSLVAMQDRLSAERARRLAARIATAAFVALAAAVLINAAIAAPAKLRASLAIHAQIVGR